MEKYEVKGFERYKVFLAIAIIAFVVYAIFEIILKDSQNQYTKLLFYVISLSFIYWFFFIIFDNLLWKIRIFNIPNLNGKWNAKIISSYPHDGRKSEKDCILLIRQTFTKIKIVLETDTSKSFNVNGFLDITKEDSFHLSYEYENRTNGKSTDTMNDHKGYCILDFDKNDNKKRNIVGNGNYFNDIRNRVSHGFIENIHSEQKKTYKQISYDEIKNLKLIPFILWFILIFISLFEGFNYKSPIPIILEIFISIALSIVLIKISPLEFIKNIYYETFSLFLNTLKEKFSVKNKLIITFLDYILGLYITFLGLFYLVINVFYLYFVFDSTDLSGYDISIIYTGLFIGLLLINTFIITLFWFIFVLPKKLENNLGNWGATPIVGSLLLLFLCIFAVVLNPKNSYYDILFFSLLLGFIFLFIGNIIFLSKDINILVDKNDDKHFSIFKYVGFIFVYIIIYGTFITFIVDSTDPATFSTIDGNVIDYLYFTVITISTVGYGDITAGTLIGKVWSIILSLQGFIYFALLIGILSGFIMRKVGKS